MIDTIHIPDKRGTRIIAHRGASYLERENTLPAFIAACNRSYFGIETDVHSTLDGQFVIMHESNTSRVAFDKCVIEESTFKL